MPSRHRWPALAGFGELTAGHERHSGQNFAFQIWKAKIVTCSPDLGSRNPGSVGSFRGAAISYLRHAVRPHPLR